MEVGEKLNILGNKYNVEILAAADEPRTAQELSDELDIPQSTCYRRVNELSEAGFLQVEDDLSAEDGSHSERYQRRVSRIEVEFETETPAIETEGRFEEHALDEVWRTLSEST
ncbi:MAG: ArsR/SmtB family transcription factor [Haloplanus sp.]